MKNLAASWIYGLGSLVLVGAVITHATAQNQVPEGNRITLLALNQPPCTTPTAKSVLKTRLAYAIAPQEQSEYGFTVSIKFQSSDPRMTFSSGLQGVVTVTSRHDTLMLEYPLAGVWADPRLKRPLTCYLYLHRNTAPGRSTVIAKTPAIVFKECM